MPNLGQGGCQAIEDAYELGKHLSAAGTYDRGLDRSSVGKALQDFYKDRMPRVAGVSLLSRLASDLIINAFDTPWNPWGDGLGTSWTVLPDVLLETGTTVPDLPGAVLVPVLVPPV